MDKTGTKRIYLDNSLLIGWFLPYMRGITPKEEPDIIQFLLKHPEIEVFISNFSIAELMESLLHGNIKGIRECNKKQEFVMSLLNALRELVNFQIITHKGKNEIEGNFITKDVIPFTVCCKQPKDAIHVAIAQYENLCLVTHDTKSTVLSGLYKKTITDKHLYKFYEKHK